MSHQAYTRRLSAVLSADAEGYSRLMHDDEDATIRTITTHRASICDLVQQYRGRVVDSPGDNLLAEFTSVVDAVNCAVEVQRELAERNLALAENRRMKFRIGINLGDVVEQEGRIYGDGVNIAARMESLAQGGGICLSGTVYDSIGGKMGLEYEFLGEQQVKNIDKPVRAFRVLSFPGAAAHRVQKGRRAERMRWGKALAALAAALVLAMGVWFFGLGPDRPARQAGPARKTALPLPEKPSIAVLPFVNLSGDPGQDYLADGISENITIALSQIPQMFVIARNSAFTYKGKAVKVQKVAQDLGVRFVLEGSLQKSGDKLRISAQLIDAVSGHHLWARGYDRPYKDLFALVDEVTMNIVVALQIKLTSGEQGRLRRTTDNLRAWSCVARGVGPFYTYSKEGIIEARRLFRHAVELDPKYAFAWTMLAFTHYLDVRYGYSSNPRQSMQTAWAKATRSLTLDPDQSLVHSLLGLLYLLQRKYAQALQEGEKAIALGPNHADILVMHANTLIYTGQPQRAVDLCKKAIRLHPFCPVYFHNVLALSLRRAGHLEEAEAVVGAMLKQKLSRRMTLNARSNLVIIHMKQGRERAARREVKQILTEFPETSVSSLTRRLLYQDPAVIKETADILRKAGFPETAAAAGKP